MSRSHTRRLGGLIAAMGHASASASARGSARGFSASGLSARSRMAQTAALRSDDAMGGGPGTTTRRVRAHDVPHRSREGPLRTLRHAGVQD